MDRRTLLKTAASVIPMAYVWIPRIAIAQHRGDAREAVIKARTVVADNWTMESKSSTTVLAERGEYTSSISASRTKMQTHDYVSLTEFSRQRQRGLAMVGAFRRNQRDYCNAYFRRRAESDIAYISTVPFIMKSYALQRAVKGMAASSTVEYFYPVEYVEIFEAVIASAPQVPARVIAQDAIWVTTYNTRSGAAGNGTFRVSRRRDSQLVYEENFEYDFT